MKQSPTASKLRRRLLWAASALLALIASAILALPAALSTRPGTDWLLIRANRALAPGMLRVDGMRFSWFRATRMTWFILYSKEGHETVAAPTATWDRNLFQILFERPKLGALTLHEAAVAVERGPGGTIDLYETLRPVIGLDAKTSAKIVVANGRLKIHGQGLAEPVEAEHAEIVVDIVPKPGPIAWRVRLANGEAGASRSEFDVDGRLDTRTTPGDLEIRVAGRDWPLAIGGNRGGASGRLVGTLSAERKEGRWAFKGDAALVRVAAKWPGFEGESLGVDHVSGAWEIEQTADGWAVEVCEISTPRATLTAVGNVSNGGKIDINGEAGLTGKDGLRGRWSAEGKVGTANGGYQVDGGVRLTEGKGEGEGERVSLRVRASATEDVGRIDLAELGVESEYVRVEAAGKIDDPAGKRLVDLTGKVAPNWEKINAWLAQNVEPGARVSGKQRAFHVRAALGEGKPVAPDGEIGLAIDGADVYGMKFGPVAVVLRAKEGKLAVDPIDTTVNEGRLHVEPAIRVGEGTAPTAVVLGKGTSLTDAAVNDEVSRRVLSFVAPVLDNATRVRGRVSATIEKAEFPILDQADGRGPTVEGSVVFQDLEFIPGPLVDGLLAMTGREDRPTLKLNDPVSLTIADRRVTQRGLTVPIGDVSKIEIEGWVGFDRALNLTASVPVLTNKLADRPILGAIAADARIRVPIRGTLRAPEIDREAFKLGMKDLGRELLGRGALQGAAGILERLSRPRDPDAPPPPTAAERRERRQERRAERRLGRENMPD